MYLVQDIEWLVKNDSENETAPAAIDIGWS